MYVTDEEEIDMFTPQILDRKRSQKPDQNVQSTTSCQVLPTVSSMLSKCHKIDCHFRHSYLAKKAL